MIFNLTEQSIFFITFIILAALLAWICLDILFILRKKGKEPLPIKISEDFRQRLKKEAEEEVRKIIEEFKKSVEEFKETLQETSLQIITSYKSSFGEQVNDEMSNLTKFALETQNRISKAAENKILELTKAAEREFVEIQEANSKNSTQIYQSAKEILQKKTQEVEKEIDNYKRWRLEEIDKKIYQMLGEVARKTMGKAIDLSDHENLVMEALEKAKKQIF